MVSVVPANVQDRDGSAQVVHTTTAKYRSLEKLFVDAGYSGSCAVQLQQEHQTKTWRWFGIRLMLIVT